MSKDTSSNADAGERSQHSDNNDKEADASRGTFSEATLFAEYPQALDCISTLCRASLKEEERDEALTKLRNILQKYLECPTLLDPYLQNMVSPLSQRARECIQENSSVSLRYVLSALYALCKVRGRKYVQRFLPHEASDVEPVLSQLQTTCCNLQNNKNENTVDKDVTAPLWESACMLWLWMGKLSLVPFDSNVMLDNDKSTVIMELAQNCFGKAGPTREISAACLSKWLSRHDWQTSELPRFVEYAKRVLQQDHHRAMFCQMAVLQTLNGIVKTESSRQIVEIVEEPLWETMLEFANDKQHNSAAIRKLLTKWFARMACAYLPPRVAPWRYQRGRRCLLENLTASTKTKGEESLSVPGNDNPASSAAEADATKQSNGSEDDNDDEDFLYPVVDQVEDAMDFLIKGLQDSSTGVRWSAAKGVGRVTERLPRICAHDVLDAILELFMDVEKEHAWHGACLALAELARRGLLLPSRLQDVVPAVIKAIQYDVRRGHASVGAQVRDAACYTYWAFARAYAPSVLRPYIPQLSESIVIASLFDREVNCRRAASAAFQECVGRQGANVRWRVVEQYSSNVMTLIEWIRGSHLVDSVLSSLSFKKHFKHGISILTAADYYSLGNRNDAFTSVALHVAQFPEYQKPIICHLYEIKLYHWDVVIRILSSKSLHDLTTLNVDFMANTVVPTLLPRCTDEALLVRHGAILGLAEVVLALGTIQNDSNDEKNALTALSESTMSSIADMVPTIEKARLYRGRGGELMRSAVCRLIECTCLAHVPLTVRQQVRLLDSVDENLKHPSEDIQESASKALYALMRSYFPVGPKGPSDRLQKRLVDKYVNVVSTDDNPAATRGFALALGSLPAKVLAPSSIVLSSVLDCVCKAARLDAKVGGEGDAETRRNAIMSLSRICDTVGIGAPVEPQAFPVVGLNPKQVCQVFHAFFLALQDYNMDRRGDVGSWSRIAAMSGLQSLTCLAAKASFSGRQHDEIEQILPQSVHLAKNAPEYFDKETSVRVIGALLKQLSEKLDSVRSHAGRCLESILTNKMLISFIPQRISLLEALSIDSQNGVNTTNWADAAITFPMVMKAADIDVFFSDVINGMVISVGGITKNVTKHATASLLTWVRRAKTDGSSSRITMLGDVLLQMFKRYLRQGRVILPLLKTLDLLISHGCLDQLVLDEAYPFSRNLFMSLKTESSKCNDVKRLLAIVGVSVSLLSSGQKELIKEELLPFLVKMLVHPFPRIRRFTADQLYMRLLEDPTIVSDKQNIDTAMELLLNTAWDADMELSHLQETRNELANMVGVVTPQGEKALKRDRKLKNRIVDEYESYASLVNEVAR